MLIEKFNRLENVFVRQLSLFPARHSVLYFVERLLPVIAKSHLARCSDHLAVIPGKFFFSDGDQLFRVYGIIEKPSSRIRHRDR